MGGGGERGEQGTETARRLDNREGDLDERAAAADKEDERAGQSRLGNSAVLLPPCLASRYAKYNKNIVIT